jgi:peptide/nickel transport system permease protein
MLKRTLLSQPSLAAGILLLFVFALVAIAAPLIAPTPEGKPPTIIPRDGFGPVPESPRPGYPLGTLEGGGDIFYGLIWGTRAAFRIGLIVTAGRMVLGILLGLIAGFYGGLVDSGLMRFTDAFLAFPIMAAAMVMMVLFGPSLHSASAGPSPTSNRVETVIMLSLILFGWMAYARLIRGNILAEREQEYIQAARSVGVTNGRIMVRHLLPNVTRGLFVLAASDIGAMVILVAAFNFIGFGVPSKGSLQTSWGQMLSVARNWIIGTPVNAFEYWYTYIPVSIAIVLFSVGWNLTGDGLRNMLDPRSR